MNESDTSMKRRLVARGHEGAWVVRFPIMIGAAPLLSGHGTTKQAAVDDLKHQVELDPLAPVWLDEIDWSVVLEQRVA